jgi:hypothetical protein
MTGLANAEVMRAAYDVGIRQVISDASVRCEDNPSPNAGYYNALVPTLLQIPRRASDLYFNVSQPAEWIAEYQALRSVGPISYDQLVDIESTEQLRYLMRGETDPWMFHQANLRDLGGGQSLLTAFLDGVLSKYAARSALPIVSPTMDELAQKVKARMAFDASGVSASLEPGGKLTVQVDARGDGAGHRVVHAGRRELRGPADLVPAARGRAVGHAVARRLQTPTSRRRRRAWPTDCLRSDGRRNCPPGTGTGGSGGAGGERRHGRRRRRHDDGLAEHRRVGGSRRVQRRQRLRLRGVGARARARRGGAADRARVGGADSPAAAARAFRRAARCARASPADPCGRTAAAPRAAPCLRAVTNRRSSAAAYRLASRFAVR